MRTATPESQAWKRQLSQAQTNAANAKRYMLSLSLQIRKFCCLAKDLISANRASGYARGTGTGDVGW
jgi:hypothetical protein